MSDEEELENEDAVVGHNSNVNKETAARLKSIVDRVETLEAEKKDLASDVKEIFEEAKSAGFDVKAIKGIIKMRKLKAEEVKLSTGVIETYCRALGMSSYLE